MAEAQKTKKKTIGHFNATAEQMWRWFTMPGTDAEFELKLITRDELLKSNAAGDTAVFANHVARNLMRGFKNLIDCNGVDIPNTPDNRVVILQSLEVWAFVQAKLLNAAEWHDEGKGDSGSVS